MLSACGADSEAEIVMDAQIEQQSTKPYHGVASNTDQNDVDIHLQSAVVVYADNAGYYLRQTINHLESIAPLFEDDTLGEHEVKAIQRVIIYIKEKSVDFMAQERPMEFDGFHNINLSLLTEIDALERVLDNMETPISPLQIQNARVYYENSVISHQQLEMEYQSLAEELGFY